MISYLRVGLIAASLAASVHAQDTGYRRLYVFGDSYSDIGAGYVDGNGPTAVAYLAKRMGLTLVPPQAPGSGAQSIDFAVSGAQTGAGSGHHVKEAWLGYGMMNQVQDFARRVQKREIQFEPDRTLFFIAGGLNDKMLATAVTVANLRQEIALLRTLGAQHVTVALLPTKIPSFADVGLRLNPALIELVRSERAESQSDVWLNHWGSDFDQIIQHPRQYGLTEVVEACAGRTIFDEDPTPKGNPDTFFFYHKGHPSTAVHRQVGDLLYAELTQRLGRKVPESAAQH